MTFILVYPQNRCTLSLRRFTKISSLFDALCRGSAVLGLLCLSATFLTPNISSSSLLTLSLGTLSSSIRNVLKPADLAISPEWMFAAYGGAPFTYPSNVRVLKTGVKDFEVQKVKWQGRPFINPIYYGARVVHWFSNVRMGTMLDFTHSKAISIKDQKVLLKDNLSKDPPLREVLIKDIFDRLEASHGHNMLTWNALLRLPSLGFSISPYVGLGAGIALPHSEVQLVGDAKRTYEYQMAGPVGQALIGLEFRLSRMSYFLEYKFTFADYRMPLSGRDGFILFTDLWKQFLRWFSGSEPENGWVETKFVSHQAIGGLGVRVSALPNR